jgi:mRNA interferase MazF
MSPSSTPRRGEVWWFDPDPVRGRELGRKIRPGLVVSIDEVNAGPSEKLIVVPGTSVSHGIPSHIRFSYCFRGQPATMYFCCEDVRAISVERLLGRMGSRVVPPSVLRDVETWLAYLMNIDASVGTVRLP